ncbi:hypothetical protein H5410_051035 [Solanum commersonii]|uniref:Uncharacterized protein n=1 Tax=Solanum commersonii TaxID=4109 RepID=A0A9J5WZR8_SOLCO|nr:hypothetical protein H5410_051035 [Solanum commersonii]
MSLQITFQDKVTQMDLDKENTIEKILNTMILLCTKIDSMDKELQQMKSQQHDNKYAKLSQSEDLKIPELEVWSYYTREQTMIYSNSRETREVDMEEIRQWILSLLKPEQQPTTRAIRRNFISTEIMENYCRTIGHKHPDHQCSKCYGEDNVIPAVNLE